MAVQSDDVECDSRHMHGQSLGVGEQEAESAAEFPLSLQGVDQCEGQTQSVDQ